ncbi:MAG: tetratricopeptide repeat protein [Gammaproteobacteria bacterium]|jgi:tetratricopeptide (TPR) repeat protein
MFDTVFRCLFSVSLLWASTVVAQPMVVLGGGQKAQDCFTNAEIAAGDVPVSSRSLLEPCDYALEHLAMSPRDTAATLANRGIVHAALSDFDAALSDYEAAIELGPSTPEFYINRGNSFFMLREYGKALDDYDLSLELGIEQRHFAYFNKGLTLERLGNDPAAEQAYLQALESLAGWTKPEEKLDRVRQRMAEAAAE